MLRLARRTTRLARFEFKRSVCSSKNTGLKAKAHMDLDFDELDRLEAEAKSGQKSVIRVLCLHGGGTNAKVMDYQTKKLQLKLGDKAQFSFLEGSKPWTDPVHPMIQKLFGEGPYFGWYGVQNEAPERDYYEAMLDLSVKFTYTDADAAVKKLEDYVATAGPFDVLLGFSQGTIPITLATALYKKRGIQAPWKLNVLVCGIPVRDSSYDDWFHDPLEHRTVLVYGKQDELYEYGQNLKNIYSSPSVFEHEEGHKFPRDQGMLAAVAEEMMLHGLGAPGNKL